MEYQPGRPDREVNINLVNGTVTVLFAALLVFLVVVLFHKAAGWPIISHRTTYCTSWVKVVKITPTNADNGKYSDEQYIVKWSDGTVEGRDQGAIDPYRCTHTVRVPDSQRQRGWKTVDESGNTDWSS